MKLLKNLILVEVAYENHGEKAVLTFLDEEHGEVRVVNFNRQAYSNNEYVDDADKAAKVDEWCTKYFNTTFDRLTECVGELHDVYCYESFNSLWETAQEAKFTKDMCGEIFNTTIDEITVDDLFIKIYYKYKEVRYCSKMSMCKWIDSMNKFFADPIQREQAYRKFEDKFGVPVAKKDELIGKDIIVEVKGAFGGKSYWGDIKKFPKKA